MNSAKAIGIALKRLRTSRGLTQEALAHDSGLSLTSLARIETGVQEPKVGTVAELANDMHLKGSDLLREMESVQHEANKLAKTKSQ